MKKPAEPWQPMLLDLGGSPAPKEEPPVVEERIEYDAPVRRRPARARADEAPWWQRAHQVETQKPSNTQAVLSWGASWLKLISGEGWLEGLRAGQRLVLESSVRGLEVRAGVVEAAVAGGKTKPQRVQLRIAPLTSAEWARLVRQVLEDGNDAAACAGLEDERVPIALVDAADRHAVPLLPRRLVQIVSACTCGGAQLPCDHVLAVHLGVGRKLDAEPQTLLALRGGSVTELLDLFARVREELQTLAEVRSAPEPSADPFAAGPGSPPAWELLGETPVPRPPLPLPEGWRVRETLDALVRRIGDAVRAQI